MDAKRKEKVGYCVVKDGFAQWKMHKIYQVVKITLQATSDNLRSVMCVQRKVRPVCAFAQSDQNFYWAYFG